MRYHIIFMWSSFDSTKLVQRHNMQFPKLNGSENSSLELWEENWAEVN